MVVTESIFSMDGDAADLAGLAELKRRRPFVLLLDEAHGTGVYGPTGSGYAAECGLQEAVDVTVVTLSKGLGCAGGRCARGPSSAKRWSTTPALTSFRPHSSRRRRRRGGGDRGDAG